MTQDTSKNLKTVAKGGVLFGAGSLGASFLKFLTGVIIIRLLEKNEYGLISLGYVLVNVVALVSSLGMNAGVSRLIARAREDQKQFNPKIIANTSLQIRGVLGISLSIILYNCAGELSRWLSKPDLEYVLQVFSFLVFPLVMIQGLTAIFQGYQKSKPKALFQDLAIDSIKLILVGVMVFIGMHFHRLLFIYVAATWLAFICYLIYSLNNLNIFNTLSFNKNIWTNILLFCLPLLGVGLINNFTPWIGTMILGFTNPASEIAIYNAPQRLTVLLHLPLSALAFIYTPTATRLYTQNDSSELKELYVSTTKWASVFTLPIALYFLIDAEYIVTLLFSTKYENAANVLRVFSIGYLFNTMAGPSAMTLISTGNTKFVFWSSLVALLVSLSLGLSLIPTFGAIGASCASMAALLMSNIFLLCLLIKKNGIYPLSRDNFNSVAIALSALFTLALFLLIFKPSGHILHGIVFVTVVTASFVIPLLSGVFDSSDIAIIKAVEQRIFKRNLVASRLSQWVAKKSITSNETR